MLLDSREVDAKVKGRAVVLPTSRTVRWIRKSVSFRIYHVLKMVAKPPKSDLPLPIAFLSRSNRET